MARARTGLSMTRRRILLGQAATTPAAHHENASDSGEAVALSGRRLASNFDVVAKNRGGGPHENPHEAPQARSTSDEHPGQQPALNTTYAQVNDPEEDR
jgi:hypothetical protein